MLQTGLEGWYPRMAKGVGGARGPGDPGLLSARGLTCAGCGLEADSLSLFPDPGHSCLTGAGRAVPHQLVLTWGAGCGPHGAPVPSSPRACAPGRRVGLGVRLPSRERPGSPQSLWRRGAGPQQLLCPDLGRVGLLRVWNGTREAWSLWLVTGMGVSVSCHQLPARAMGM